nr:amidohydrolase [bacterium]
MVLIFQPAEESIGGAHPMVENGVLKNPDVDEVYGMHIFPGVPQGKIGLKTGPLMASTTEFVLSFHGKPSHGAMPQHGRDALLAAASFLTQVQGIIARGLDPMSPALLTVGKLEAGNRRNIIPDLARMEGIIRTFDEDTYASLKAQLMRLIHSVEEMYEVKAEYVEETYYPAVNNAPQCVERVRAIVGDMAYDAQAQLIAEDFSYYQKECPGAYFFLGAGREGAMPLHSDAFCFDESILFTGTGILLALVGAL